MLNFVYTRVFSVCEFGIRNTLNTWLLLYLLCTNFPSESKSMDENARITFYRNTVNQMLFERISIKQIRCLCTTKSAQ